MRVFYYYFSAFISLALLCGCKACFQNNHHKVETLPTGAVYYQECSCTEPGHSADKLKWLDKNDQPIKLGPGTDSDIYAEKQSDSINLHITKISKTMSGTYKCVTEFDGKKYVQSFTIEAYDPLYFFATPQDQFLVDGANDSKIQCRVHGDSDPYIRWQKKDSQKNDTYYEITNNEKYQKDIEGLRVKHVTTDDAGTYKCTAQGITTGEELDTLIKVDIHTVPIIKELRPSPAAAVNVNEYLSIDCVADGYPHPDYVWTKIDGIPLNETNTTRHYNVNTLIFDSIKPEERGKYQCTATNDAGNVSKEIYVEVLLPPVITHFENITAIEGTTIEIGCNVTGRPEPNVTLSFEGMNTQFLESDEYKIIPNFAFLTVDRRDEGIYVCNASNEVDFEIGQLYLTVLHRPYFEETVETIWAWDGRIVNLSCVHDSNPPSNISWRFDSNDVGTSEQVQLNKKLLESLNSISEHHLTVNVDDNYTYGIYYCKATNEHGSSTKVITVKKGFKPSAVTNVTIEETTATSVTFFIETPQFEGPEIIGYTAQYDEAENYNITDIHLNRTWAKDRPYKIEKLKPNTSYLVSFVALNDVGVGERSEKLEFSTLEKSVPETPVLDLESIDTTKSNVVINWRAPDDNGEPIDYYTIRYCSVNKESPTHTTEENEISPEVNNNINSQSPCKKIKSLGTAAQLQELVENTTYFLEVIAHNAQGDSNPANLSLTITAPENQIGPDSESLLSAGAIIGISIVVVVVILILFDVLLLVWRRKGIIASICIKGKKSNEASLMSRDRKGLLNTDSTDERRHNGHKEFEYNKTTGTVTGKHSAV